MPPSSAQPDSHDSAKPIEMPKFRWSPPPADPTVRRAPASVPADNKMRPLPKKPEAKSSPLPWPLPPVKELTKRRMLLQEEREQRQPSALQAESIAAVQPESVAEEKTSPAPVEKPEPHEIRVEETLVSEPVTTTSLEEPHNPTPLQSELQHFFREMRTRSVQTYRVLASASQRVKQRIYEDGASVAGWSKRIQSACNTAIRTTKIRWVSRVSKASADTTPKPQIVQPAIHAVPGARAKPTTIHAFGTDARLYWLTVTRSAQQFWERKVLIRVRGGKQLRNGMLRIESTRAHAVAALRRNERLASSMFMAGLSALLALGLVLVIKRYEPVTVITAKPTLHPTAAVSASTVIAKPAVEDVEGVAVAKPVIAQQIVETSLATPIATTKPTTQKVASHKAVARRAHHRENDDDYVAPDTYVYYGHR